MKTLKSIFRPLSLIAIVLIAFTSCSKDDDTIAPVVKANFTYVTTTGSGVVNFTNTSENANTYQWSFGDGGASTDANPTHVYTEDGDYTITLTAKNTSGGSNTFMVQITIDGVSPVVNNLLTNGDFEDGGTGWLGNALDVRTEGGNSYNFSNVSIAGNAFDVNLSYVVEITQGQSYRLTFNGSSDGNRTILAGIGLNQDPWTNVVETVNLTETSQTFSLEFTAGFGAANSRVIFDMGADTGVVVIDNVVLEEIETPIGPVGDNLVANGTFDDGSTGWVGNAVDVRTEGGNSYNFANIAIAGNSYDVNASYVLEITQGKTYVLTFEASSDGNRTMLAGIGLNQDPWTSVDQTVNLTSTMQTFTMELTATDFGNANSRVLFDMGADTGVVVIDNVTLVEKL